VSHHQDFLSRTACHTLERVCVSTNEIYFAQLQQPELLGTTENELGLRKWLEDQGHTLVTTSDKEGEDSTFDKELVDAEIIITTPYVITPYFLALQTRTEPGNHTLPSPDEAYALELVAFP